MREYTCDCEKCLCLNFFSCVKDTWKFIENKNNHTDDSGGCLHRKKMIPLNLKLFGQKSQHFWNDVFQPDYDLFQVNWLLQTWWY